MRRALCFDEDVTPSPVNQGMSHIRIRLLDVVELVNLASPAQRTVALQYSALSVPPRALALLSFAVGAPSPRSAAVR